MKAEISKQPTPRWKLGAVKTAIKFVVRHSSLVPGKTLRGWVKKYGPKMEKAMDLLENGTRIGLKLAFEEAGIPKKIAAALADFIVTFIL